MGAVHIYTVHNVLTDKTISTVKDSTRPWIVLETEKGGTYHNRGERRRVVGWYETRAGANASRRRWELK